MRWISVVKVTNGRRFTAYPFYGDAVLTTSPFSVLFGAQRPAVGVN